MKRKRGESLTWLLSLAKPERKSLIWGTFFLLIGSALGLVFPQAIRVIINAATESKDPTLVDKAAIFLAIVFLVQGVAVSARAYLFTVAGERVVARLRRDLYERLVSLDVAFFDQHKTGELISRLSNDTSVLQNTVTVNLSMALRHLAAVVGGIALLLYTSAQLTAVMIAVVPAVVLSSVFIGRRIRRLSRRVQDALAGASEVAEETFAGVRTVRVFAREAQEAGRYGEQVEKSFQLARRRSAYSAIFFGATTFSGYGAIALVLWFGGGLVLEGGLSVGDLTAFVLYTLIVAFSIGALGGLWADFMRAAGAGDRVMALLKEESTMPKEGLRPEDFEATVRLDKVSFHYPARPDVEVLRDVDLQVEEGRVVALVGPSGGGKSTIAALLSRLYDPSQGELSLGGHRLEQLDPDWLRERVGVVSQEPTLFSTSIRENILYGRPGASQDEIEAAAKAAFAHDFITAFPDGYETLVGERGVQLSGGQKQRVAIARALLKNPQVLVLDEATSALDAESEAAVKLALDKLMEGRTTLVIAHRLSTVRDADEVVVLVDGAVAERGSHEDLLAMEGVYQRLVRRQFEEQ